MTKRMVNSNTENIPSLLDDKHKWIECICVVEFDQTKGPILSYCTPNAVLTTNESKNICFQAFPNQSFGTQPPGMLLNMCIILWKSYNILYVNIEQSFCFTIRADVNNTAPKNIAIDTRGYSNETVSNVPVVEKAKYPTYTDDKRKYCLVFIITSLYE